MGDVAGLGAILTAIVTPFDDDLNVNEEAFVRLMNHLADHGSDGVVVAGSTGEAALLDERERASLVEVARYSVPSDKRLIVGTGAESTHTAQRMALEQSLSALRKWKH